MKRAFHLAFGSACVVALAVGTLVAAESPAEPKRILLLHQAGDPGPFRGKFDVAFVEAIRSASSVPIDLFDEAIEVQRPDDGGGRRFVTDYLRVKYADRRIDVIVAQGIAPLAFARENAALFGNPPIIAIHPATGEIGVQHNVIGLQGGFWITGTVDLGLALLPDTTHVVVIDGARENNPELQTEVERQLKGHRPPVDVIYLRDLPLTDLLARVSALPQQSIIFFVKQTMRTRSQDVRQTDAFEQIVATSRVPVFSQVEDLLGHGSVGGSVWRFEADARRMAAMALEIVNGANPDEMASGRASYTTFIDWRQLQHWNIPESRLPANSVVLFRPASFFVTYRNALVITALVFAAQLGLIAALLVQRARRRGAEEQMTKSRQRYRSVVDTQTELICRFLPAGTLTFVNDAYCRYWNVSREQFLGRQFTDAIPPARRDAFIERIGTLRHGTVSFDQDVLLRDGSTGWQQWTVTAILDDKGRVLEFQGVGRDITDRVRAEQALGQVEARNTAMLRAIPDLMFVLRRDGTYIDYHAREPEMLYAPPTEFLGKTVRDVMPSRLADLFMSAIERACQNTEMVHVEYELGTGTTSYFEARLVQAGPDRVLSIVRDVTDVKRAVALNRHLAGRLIASQEVERKRIARELHDDLSQKIALLNIQLDRAAASKPELVTAQLKRISGEIGEIATTVHNLSRQLHPSKLETLGLVAAIQSACRELSIERGVHIVFTHDGVPDTVDPDISLCLYRIVQEALHNISRHSQALEGRVHLAFKDGTLQLQISDSGVGFDASAQHDGLGLISMRERVAFVRGLMSMDSSPGMGTRIDVQVPLTPAIQPTPGRLQVV
jgi:PAS domain S-box-containing protein